jgi:hypothetical protein
MGTTALDKVLGGEAAPQGVGTSALDAVLDPMSKWHAAYKSGALQAENARQDAADKADLSQASPTANMLATLAPRLLHGAIAEGRATLNEPFLTPLKQHIANTQAERAALDRTVAQTEAASPRVFGPNGPGVDLPIIGNPLNPKLTTLGQMAETAPLLAYSPFSAGATGAAYNAASSVADAPQGEGTWDTIKRAGVNAGLGYLTGKATELGVTGARALKASSAPEAILSGERARSAISDPNYAAARTAAQTAPPLVRPNEMDAPDIKPYVDIARQSRTMQGKSEGEMLMEAHRLMSERQGRLKNVIDANDFKAGTSLENKDIGAAKEALLTNADQISPDFRTATEEHAEASKPISAYREGYDALRRSVGKPVAGKNLGLKTPAAFEQKTLPRMAPAEATAAGQGVLGGVRENAGPLHPIRSIPALNAGSRLLRATDLRAGTLPQWNLLRGALMTPGLQASDQAGTALTDLLRP